MSPLGFMCRLIIGLALIIPIKDASNRSSKPPIERGLHQSRVTMIQEECDIEKIFVVARFFLFVACMFGRITI